jgi:hypothetical protein
MIFNYLSFTNNINIKNQNTNIAHLQQKLILKNSRTWLKKVDLELMLKSRKTLAILQLG